jgi:hypothetical protein
MPVALMGFGTLQSFPLLKIGLPLDTPSRLDVTIRSNGLGRFRPPPLSRTVRLHGFNPFRSPFIRRRVLTR